MKYHNFTIKLRRLLSLISKFLTANELVSITEVITFYFISMILAIACVFVLLKNVFIIHNIFPLLFRIIIIPLIAHIEFLIIYFIKKDKTKFKKSLNDFRNGVKCGLTGKIGPYRFYYFTIVASFLLYIILSVAFLKAVNMLYESADFKIYSWDSLGIILLLIFRFMLIYRIVNELTFTKTQRNKYLFNYFLPIISVDLFSIIVLAIGQMNKLRLRQIFTDYISLPNFNTLFIALVVPILITLIGLFFSKPQKFIIEHENKSLFSNFLECLILTLIYWIVFLLGMTNKTNYLILRFPVSEVVYLIFQFALILGLIFQLFSFCIKGCGVLSESKNSGTNWVKIAGRIVGKSLYIQRSNLFDKHSVEKNMFFNVIKQGGLNYNVSQIKTNIFYPRGFDLFIGDEIGIIGYNITNYDLNIPPPKNEIKHILPVFTHIIKVSELRKILE